MDLESARNYSRETLASYESLRQVGAERSEVEDRTYEERLQRLADAIDNLPGCHSLYQEDEWDTRSVQVEFPATSEAPSLIADFIACFEVPGGDSNQRRPSYVKAEWRSPKEGVGNFPTELIDASALKR